VFESWAPRHRVATGQGREPCRGATISSCYQTRSRWAARRGMVPPRGEADESSLTLSSTGAPSIGWCAHEASTTSPVYASSRRSRRGSSGDTLRCSVVGSRVMHRVAGLQCTDVLSAVTLPAELSPSTCEAPAQAFSGRTGGRSTRTSTAVGLDLTSPSFQSCHLIEWHTVRLSMTPSAKLVIRPTEAQLLRVARREVQGRERGADYPLAGEHPSMSLERRDQMHPPVERRSWKVVCPLSTVTETAGLERPAYGASS
jgi:hypothetical protein